MALVVAKEVAALQRSLRLTAISALIFEGKFPILEARFISEQSRPSARPGRENGCAYRSVQRPSDQASLCSMPGTGSLRGLASRFSLLAMKQVKSVCQSLFFACRSVHCVSFTCMECVGNVCEAKKQLTRVCSGDRHLSLHLTGTRAVLLPRSQCLCRRRSGKGKPKIFLPFDHSKAWHFSEEEIASWRRSPVTGSKYSAVDRERTYTPTASRRPPSSL